MNKLLALLTIAVLLTSVLAPATAALALATVKPEGIGTPSLSKTTVYIGPDHTITISITDDDPLNITYNGYNGTAINITLYEQIKTLNSEAPDYIYAFLQIFVNGTPVALADVVNKTGALIMSDAALLNLTETGNATNVFTITLTVMPANITGVDNVVGPTTIYVKPEDVAKGVEVKISYPDLVAGELQWITKTFEIKAVKPEISVDKTEIVPGQNFTITLAAASLDIYGDAVDYIAVNTTEGEGTVYWVTSTGKIAVGKLDIKVYDAEGTLKASGLVKCIMLPVLQLTGGLYLYEETDVNSTVFEIPVNGTCLRNTVAGLAEGWKINITYYDFYTGETVYATITVKPITVQIATDVYYNGELVKKDVSELPIIYYWQFQDRDIKPRAVGLNYTLNITVYDPAYLANEVEVQVYNVTDGLITTIPITLQGSGDTRYATLDVELNATHLILNGNAIELSQVYRYPVTGYLKIIYASEYSKVLPIALPKDDKIAATPASLDRVAGNVTLKFVFGDLPVVPSDLAIEIKWTSRSGVTYYYYFSATELGFNATTGKAEVNLTKLLAPEFGNDYAAAARAIIGTTVYFYYEDPMTSFNAGRSYTFETKVDILAHDAKVTLSSTNVGPFQWLNITIEDPDIFYEGCSYIQNELILLFNATSTSKTLADLVVEGSALCSQANDTYTISIKLWDAASKGYLEPSGDVIYIYYFDDTPANKYVDVYRYKAEVSVMPTEGEIVEPKDGSIVSPGQKLVIVVSDPDPHKAVSPDTRDNVYVIAWSDSYPKRKNITLLETDKASNVFNTTILVTDDWSQREEPGVIYARPGDKIYIVYHDNYPDKIKLVVLVVKAAAPAPAEMKWIYINVSGTELAKDAYWWIDKDPYTGVERLMVKLPFYNATSVDFDVSYYSVLYYRESPTAKYKFVDLGSDTPDLSIAAGAESVILPIATVSKIKEDALKYGGMEDGLYKIYATLIIIDKATGDLATKVWTPEFGTWVVWPVTLTIYVDAQGNIVKVVLGSA